MSKPLTPVVAHQVTRVYEIYDRYTRDIIGKVEVPTRQDIQRMHPWTIEHMKDATEATGSRTGVRYVGESIIRQTRARTTGAKK